MQIPGYINDFQAQFPMTVLRKKFGEVLEDAKPHRVAFVSGALLSLLVVLYVVVTPSINVIDGVMLYDSKRLLQAFLLLCIGVKLAVSRTARHDVHAVFSVWPRPAQWATAVVLCSGLLSASFAASTRYAHLDLVHCTLLFVGMLMVASATRRRPSRTTKVIVGATVVSASLYVVTFSVGYAGYWVGMGFSLWPESFVGFSNIRHFNQYQTWTLPIIVAAPFLISPSTNVLRKFLYALLALWWMLLLASGGRGVFIAAMIAMIGVFVIYKKTAWLWLRTNLLGGVGGGLLYWLMFRGLTASGSSVANREITKQGHRPRAWGEAFDAAVQAFPLGAGPMHYARYEEGNVWAHPHNALLQWAAEWGFVATLIAGMLIVWALYAWITQTRRLLSDDAPLQTRFVRISITAALLAGGAHSFVSGIIVTPVSQTLMVVVSGMALGLYLNEKRGDRFSSARPDSEDVRHRVVQVAALFLSGMLIYGVWSDVPDLSKRPIAYYEESGKLLMSPRYWQQGYFGPALDTENVQTDVLPLGRIGSGGS